MVEHDHRSNTIAQNRQAEGDGARYHCACPTCRVRIKHPPTAPNHIMAKCVDGCRRVSARSETKSKDCSAILPDCRSFDCMTGSDAGNSPKATTDPRDTLYSHTANLPNTTSSVSVNRLCYGVGRRVGSFILRFKHLTPQQC